MEMYDRDEFILVLVRGLSESETALSFHEFGLASPSLEISHLLSSRPPTEGGWDIPVEMYD